MKIIRPFIFFSLLLLVYSCGKAKSKSNYYFPITKFKGINVYKFENLMDSTDKSSWHMKTIYSGKDTLLKTTIVDAQERVTEVITEKISGGNSTMSSYFIYNYDSKGVSYNTSCEIIERDIYRANQQVGENIQWKVAFYDPQSQKCELTKTRTLNEIKDNQKIFGDEFSLSIPEKAFIGKYSVESVYEKNKGLVSYKLKLPNGVIKEMILMSTEQAP